MEAPGASGAVSGLETRDGSDGTDGRGKVELDRETWNACLAYAEGLVAPESETHGWIVAELAARGLPAIQVSALEGKLLALLAATAGARRILELGTLGGYSALWLVSLLPEEARLLTIECDEAHAELAREAFRRAGEEGRIELRVGDARAILPALARAAATDETRFDAIFLDADKASYPVYLERSRELLRPGGLLLADNAFWDGRVLEGEEGEDDEDTRGIREFNRRLAEDPRFQTAIVPVRDGLAVGRFLG